METLPAEAYWSPAVHDLERRTIFGRSWLCLGPAAPVAAPGSYLAESVAGWPMLVVRDAAGALRAFHNVCRHRAGPLVDDGCGTSRSLVCRYHGWAYALDGTLTSTRGSGLAPDATADLDLFEVRAAEWRGVLFVCLDPSTPPLADWLGGLVDEAAPYPMESWAPAGRVEHRLACNWKTYGDNYAEGYHIPLVHPELHRAVRPGTYRVDVHDGWTRHRADTRDGTVATGAWLWHWPNVAFNLYEHGMSIERWWPTGPTSCVLVLDYCFADLSPAGEARNRLDMASSDRICDEDRRICEAVQRNLEAGTYRSGLLAPDHEQGVAELHRLVRAAHRS